MSKKCLLPRSLWPIADPLNKLQCQQIADFALESLITTWWEPFFDKDKKELVDKINKKCIIPYKIIYGNNCDYSEQIINSFVSSSDETRCGDWLEEVARYTAQLRFGYVWELNGLDYSFSEKSNYYNVQVKTAPNWGNGDQWSKLIDNFKDAEIKCLTKGKQPINLLAHAGIDYVRKPRKDFGIHYLLEGPDFWEFQSGYRDLFRVTIKPVFDHKSLDHYKNKRKVLLQELLESARKKYIVQAA